MLNCEYPCLVCENCVQEDHDSIGCDFCNKWVHLECTDITPEQLSDYCNNSDLEYKCVNCSAAATNTSSRTTPSLVIEVNNLSNPASSNIASPSSVSLPSSHPTTPNFFSSNLSTSPSNESLSSEFSNVSFKSSDFEYITDSDDPDDRGLNFHALPNYFSNNRPKSFNINSFLSHGTKSRKINSPCSVCGKSCITNRQNCLCCNICDEWVHLKCTDLTLNDFNFLSSPENFEKPYYCNLCLFGKNQSLSHPHVNRPLLSTILNSPNCTNLTPNSVFNSCEDSIISNYYTIDDINDFNITLSTDLISR